MLLHLLCFRCLCHNTALPVSLRYSSHHTHSLACTIINKVWDNEVGPNGEAPTFALLFSLRGHARSITALQIGDFTFASGDASGQVRVWELIQPASAGGPSEASASAAGGFAGQATVWIGPDGQDPKWARCRCVLRVKHQRSEDAPDYAKVRVDF